MPNVDTENFSIYLKEFSYHLSAIKKNAIIIMDGASCHKSKELIVPENIKLVTQPPYSPELNPIEKLWQFIKRHTVKNKIFNDLEDIEKELCHFIKQMTPEIFKTVCAVKYLLGN